MTRLGLIEAARRFHRRSGLAPSEDEGAGKVRLAQLAALTRATPITMVTNAANVVLVSGVVHNIADPLALGLWCVAMLWFSGLTAWSQVRRMRRPTKRRTASHRAILRATHYAGALGFLWALVAVLWFPASDAVGQTFLAIVLAGMLSGGGFLLATVPPAAITYVAILYLGCAAGILLSNYPFPVTLIVLLTLFALTVLRSAHNTFRLFYDRFTAELELKERGHVIELLLNEFEESSSDWLFQIDTDHRIVQCSPRLAMILGRDPDRLIGRPFDSLVLDEGRLALLDTLTLKRPFKGLEVKASIEGRPRWWSLTANPIQNEDGDCVGWRGVGSDVTETKLAHDKVNWMAKTDMLTGLINRAEFRRLGALAVDAAKDGGAAPAIGILDLDNFKTVNDTLGHPVGDQLLCMVADQLRTFAGDDIKIARLGGDEFGLLVCDANSRAAVVEFAQDIVLRLSRAFEIETFRVTAGGTIGLAFWSGGEDVDQMIRNADFALYHAKENSRGTVHAYDRQLHHEAQMRRRLQEDLRGAVGSGQFSIVYQPIVDLKTGEPVSYEALLRWDHPEFGPLDPEAFITIAESSGQIDRLGNWVLKTVCAEAARWHHPAKVAVNISPAQLGGATLVDNIRMALSDSGLPPTRLEVEITESLFIHCQSGARDFIEGMRELGIRVALDDFGTGYSSLSYLTSLQVHKLKIDRSFVSGTGSVSHRRAIIAAIVAMARSMNIQTVAEGVECEGHLQMVRELGCDQAQGYHFSGPLTADVGGLAMMAEPRLRDGS